MAPLEGLVDAGLVHLDRRPLAAPEGPDLPRHHVAEPHPHVPRGGQAHGAPPRALPEGGALERGVDVLEPGGERQLRERQQTAGPLGEPAPVLSRQGERLLQYAVVHPAPRPSVSWSNRIVAGGPDTYTNPGLTAPKEFNL